MQSMASSNDELKIITVLCLRNICRILKLPFLCKSSWFDNSSKPFHNTVLMQHDKNSHWVSIEAISICGLFDGDFCNLVSKGLCVQTVATKIWITGDYTIHFSDRQTTVKYRHKFSLGINSQHRWHAWVGKLFTSKKIIHYWVEPMIA